MEMYGGVPPPPPSSAQPSSLPSVCPAPGPENLPLALAPPPGFSDSEHSLSDTDSLGSEPNNFQRFGVSRVSKPRSQRMMPQVMYFSSWRSLANANVSHVPTFDLCLSLYYSGQNLLSSRLTCRPSTAEALESLPVECWSLRQLKIICQVITQ